MKQAPSLTVAARIVLPFACGYFLSYLFRTVNAVLAPNLVADLGLDAAILGLLTSVYFLAFALAQIPLGVMLDRYGPRKVEFVLLLVAAVGAFIFANAESKMALLIGRGLIGLGVSACLMGAFKAFVMWFPKDRLPLVNGIQMMAGSVGIVAAAQPVEIALGYTDWRGVYHGLGVLAIVVAVFLFVLVPERRREGKGESLRQSIAELKGVMKNPVFWSIAPISAMTQAVFLALHTLWAGPWLRDVAGMARDEIAIALTVMGVALIPSYALVGLLSTWLVKYGVTTIAFSITGIILFILTQVVLLFEPIGFAVGAWVMFNVLATTAILTYAALTQAFDERLSGRVITACNAIVFMSAFAFQYLAGVIIDGFSKSESDAFSPEGYQVAIGVMIGLQLLALLSHFIIRARYRTECNTAFGLDRKS